VPHLAQVNVARLLAPIDAPSMRGFVGAIAAIDRLAAASPGFLWRYGGADGHGVSVQPEEGGPVFVNLSLWTDYDALHDFVYRSAHARYLRQRSRWFAATPQPATALWWVAPGVRPSIDDALRRLRYLRDHGPTPRVFSLRRRFGADGRPSARRGAGTTRSRSAG
jgi:hypothetical protein